MDRKNMIFVKPAEGVTVPDPSAGVRQSIPAEGAWVDGQSIYIRRRMIHGELEEAAAPADMPMPTDEEEEKPAEAAAEAEAASTKAAPAATEQPVDDPRKY